MADDKPICSCGSNLTFIIDRAENGNEYWRCLSCGKELVIRRPYRSYRPLKLKERQNLQPLWRHLEA
jgi:hypothetical protein